MNLESIEIIRSRRRTLSLEVGLDGRPRVRAPLRTSLFEIQNFVAKHAAWLARTAEKMKLRAASAPQPKVFAAGEMVLFLGAKYRLRFESVPAIELRGEEIWLPIRFESAAQEKLEAWYRAEARRILPKRIGHFARQMEVQPRGLRISSARTRWGSCSARDSLNFSWRLVLAPLPVLDYVVVHELAHIPHKNHGQRFWHKVAKTMPDFESHKKWLRQHGAELMRY